MSTLSLRKIKHDSSAVDNITTNSDGGVGIGGIDPSALPAFIDHAVKVQNGGGLGIQSTNATDNRWIFFGYGTTSGDVQRAGIVNQGSDQSLALTTAGTQRLIVDAAGRVTTPYQIAFWVKPSTNAASEINGSNIFTWSDIKLNIGSCYSSSTGRFTAPIAGVYIFTANTMANSGTGRYQTVIQKNGGWVCSGGGDSSQYGHSSPSIVINLAVGDYVEHYKNSGTPYGSAAEHAFGGYLLG